MLKRTISLLLCLFLLSSGCLAFAYDGTEYQGPPSLPDDAPTTPDVNFAILYEESTGTVMYTKNADRTNAPASMTKVMTALLVLEHNPTLEGSYVVPPEAVSEQYCYWMNAIHLEEGEEITIRDLMHYLLIPSGNEAATTLAHYVAGDIDTFIQMMNDRADQLGMTKTHYADPHGLSEYNRISCEDMLILAREAMKHEEFRNIVSKTVGTLPASNKREEPYRYNTTNRVLSPRNVPEYDGGFSDDIVGIKTGYIRVAGYNLACCMNYDEEDLTVYSIVMHGKSLSINGAERLSSHTETLNLMRWARTFEKEGVAAGERILSTATQGNRENNVQLAAAADAMVLTRGTLAAETVLYPVEKKVSAGDVLGKLRLTDAFGNVKEVDLIAMNDAVTDRTAEYTILSAISIGTMVTCAVAATFLRKRRSRS